MLPFSSWKLQEPVPALEPVPAPPAPAPTECRIRRMAAEDLDPVISVENICFMEPISRDAGAKKWLNSQPGTGWYLGVWVDGFFWNLWGRRSSPAGLRTGFQALFYPKSSSNGWTVVMGRLRGAWSLAWFNCGWRRNRNSGLAWPTGWFPLQKEGSACSVFFGISCSLVFWPRHLHGCGANLLYNIKIH